MSSLINTVEKVNEFDKFYENQVSALGYLRTANLIGKGNKIFSEMNDKYGVPIMRFWTDFGDCDEDMIKNISEEDSSYFRKFRSYATLFPHTACIINSNKSVVDVDNIRKDDRFQKGRFERKKKALLKRHFYENLCRTKLIDFGELDLPFAYLWGNKGGKDVVPDKYCVKIGKHLTVNLYDGKFSFA